MKIPEGKWNGILYKGGFDDFSVNGKFNMEKEVLYKYSPQSESKIRLDMAYLLLKNPQIISVIRKSGGHFFHGTNANALPNILRYGINSMHTSIENNIDVTTGEQSFIKSPKQRNFVSLTDSLKVSLSYANMKPNNKFTNTFLNFGVLIGTSLEDMNGLNVFGPCSEKSEIGVFGNLPVDHIKFLAVPDDKVEFVKKMVGQKDIEVVSMNIRDRFFNSTSIEKLNMLDQSNKNIEQPNPPYPVYSKADVKPLVNKRKTSKIREIFEALKAKMHMHTKPIDDKRIINER